jgi:predicted PhzF superfamily epimerase YddE/YHI9
MASRAVDAAAAAEMNLHGAAFDRRLANTTAADWALRWFTSVLEDDLCGHATLATAHAIRTCIGEPGSSGSWHAAVSSSHGPVRTVKSSGLPRSPSDPAASTGRAGESTRRPAGRHHRHRGLA